jgi:sulfatase modifying factor 1
MGGSGDAGDAGGGGVNHGSCSDLAKTCGPHGDDDCCASSLIPGGTFYRSYDGMNHLDKSYPAHVSDFRLDAYEVTVGRFKQFVAAYAQDMIAEGAGKNPNDPSDTGWQAAWNASYLPANQAQLTSNIECAPAYQTWNAGTDDLPMNCLDWFEAEAFCIWDGGRLPTEAEWNYAAAGGTQQRVYPWGLTPPDSDANFAVYGCYYFAVAPSGCVGVGNIAPVGSAPAGDGRWGQSDLVGNVWEWAQDWYVSPYINPCNDCGGPNVMNSAARVLRGGSFNSFFLSISDRYSDSPSTHGPSYGARCARSAP